MEADDGGPREGMAAGDEECGGDLLTLFSFERDPFEDSRAFFAPLQGDPLRRRGRRRPWGPAEQAKQLAALVSQPSGVFIWTWKGKGGLHFFS
jgi:hypothetical protein